MQDYKAKEAAKASVAAAMQATFPHRSINELSQEYGAAIAAHDAAIAEYEIARDAYRARTVDDAEFLPAKAKFAAATAVVDVAFAAEAARP